MENNEKLICKADIKCKVSKVFLLIIGMLYLSWSFPVKGQANFFEKEIFDHPDWYTVFWIITAVLIILIAFILLNIVNSKRTNLSLYDNKR